MEKLDGFTLEGERGIYRPVGKVTFNEAAAMVRAAIALARANEVRELLVDMTGLTGFASPDTFERYLAVVQWAEAAKGSLRLALVAPAEMIDSERFGVTVAANRGLLSNIFASEEEARRWLGGTAP